MAKTFRITLWSGGKASLVYYVKERPRAAEGGIVFKTDDGNVVNMMGTVSVEEGEFEERRISRTLG